jgi:hypothetical protein
MGVLHNLEDARCDTEIVVTSPISNPGNPNCSIESTADDPAPCNASQPASLLLVTAHPSLRQLLQHQQLLSSPGSGPAELPTQYPYSTIETARKIATLVSVVAQLLFNILCGVTLRLATQSEPPSAHPNCNAPLRLLLLTFTSTSLLSYEAHDCAISILQHHSLSFSLHTASWT